jgi:PTH1 family peptidyl-tRNA hydrolase
MVVDTLALRWQLKFKKGKGPFEIAKYSDQTQNVVLAKPDTFMNRSGIAVQQLIRAHYTDISNCLIVCDDFHLPLGKIRIRKKGSHGGHKGLASIIDWLGTGEFTRLRLGIDLDPKMDVTDFVLAKFKSSEKSIVNEMVEMSADAAIQLMKHGIDYAMNTYN